MLGFVRLGMMDARRVIPLPVEVGYLCSDRQRGIVQSAIGIPMGPIKHFLGRLPPGLVPVLADLLYASGDPTPPRQQYSQRAQ